MFHIDPEMELLVAGAFDLQQDDVGDKIKEAGADAVVDQGLFALMKTVIDAALGAVFLAERVHRIRPAVRENSFL